MLLCVVEPLSKGMNSPITNESKDAVQSPLRKALSPINGNQKPHEALSLTQTLFSANCSTNKGLQKNGTPLDKFSTRSSALKVIKLVVFYSTNKMDFELPFTHHEFLHVQNHLVQEYIDFLNNASR